MNSAQEAKQELQAAIRYCENAISAANSTIESLDFRQELAKQKTMSKKESKEREVALTKAVKDLEVTNETLVIDNYNLERKVEKLESAIDDANSIISELRKSEKELTQANMSVVCDNDDLKDELFKLREDKERLTSLEVQLRDKISELKKGKEIVSVIPRDVAIAIFREGIKQGVSDACDALSDEYVQVDETETFGDFEVSFQRDIKLGDDLDLDWIRDKVGSYEAMSVEANLQGLLENLNFKNRIDGIDKV